MKKYHGWICIEKSEGMKDHFSVQYNDVNGQSLTRSMGYGASGAAKAVDYFENAPLNLGKVLLEPTPLGLRVFTSGES